MQYLTTQGISPLPPRGAAGDWQIDRFPGRIVVRRAGMASARLLFADGIAPLTCIRADGGQDALLQIRHVGAAPAVETLDRAIGIRVRAQPVQARLIDPPLPMEVTLDPDVSWTIAVSDGNGCLWADLDDLDLEGLVIEGGMMSLDAALPPPRGVVPIRIASAACDLTLRRPAGCALRLLLAGGADHASLDGRRVGALDGPFSWATGGRVGAQANRYEVTVAGRAVGVTLL